MKVLTMRAGSESAGWGVGADEVGGTGAAAMNASWQRFEGILVGRAVETSEWAARNSAICELEIAWRTKSTKESHVRIRSSDSVRIASRI